MRHDNPALYAPGIYRYTIPAICTTCHKVFDDIEMLKSSVCKCGGILENIKTGEKIEEKQI